jgi:histidine ammonia-lyase
MGDEGEEWRSVRKGETVIARAAVQAERAEGVTDKGCGRDRAVAAEFGEQGDDGGRIGEKELPRILGTSTAVHLGLRMPTAYVRAVIAPDASEYASEYGGTGGL